MSLGPYLLVLVCLAPLTIRAAPMVETEQAEHHSVQKRQTTVSSFFPTFNSVSRTLDGISWGTVALVVLVLLALDVIGTLALGTLFAGRSSSSLGSWELGGWVSRTLNSIDLVDTSLNYMEVEGEDCRRKAICELEYAAVSNPIARLGINTLNSNLWGLEKYSDAVEAGLSGQDCAFLYSECRSPSYTGQFSLF